MSLDWVTGFVIAKPLVSLRLPRVPRNRERSRSTPGQLPQGAILRLAGSSFEVVPSGADYWNALIADGGQESMCGWCRDKLGLSWQVISRELTKLLSSSDPEKSSTALQAMLGVGKIVIADLSA